MSLLWVTATSGDLAWGGKEQWQPGEKAHFEYHCHEGHDSSDAQAWYRSHRPVTVVREEDEENDFPRHDLPTHEDRAEAGVPVTYKIKHEDGFEHTAFEDELLRHPRHFERPDPPKPACAHCYEQAKVRHADPDAGNSHNPAWHEA